MFKKKFVIFLVSVFMFSSLFVGEYTKNETATVNIYTVNSENAENTVVCSGTVEYSKEYLVKSKNDLIIDKLYVKSGDCVEKGQLLFSGRTSTVETKATSISEDEIYEALVSGDYSIINENNFVSTASPDVKSEKIDVFAEHGGIITDISYDEGDPVKGNTTMAVISPTDDLQVVLNINESQISQISVGQQASITGAGFKGFVYDATVKSISAFAKQSASATGKATTVQVMLNIDNADSHIKSGFTAKCTITTGIVEDCIIMPYEYVCSDESGEEYVYIYNNGFAEKRYITTSTEYPNGVLISDGIFCGENVITNPSAVGKHGRVNLAVGAVSKNG